MNMPYPGEVTQTFDDLIVELCSLTRNAKVQWRETLDDDTFLCVFEGGSVEVALREVLNEETGAIVRWYESTLLNVDGRVVQSRTSQDENIEADQVDALRSLIDLARSQARNSSGVLDRVFREVRTLQRT